jgi:hypothetical protein
MNCFNRPTHLAQVRLPEAELSLQLYPDLQEPMLSGTYYLLHDISGKGSSSYIYA